MDLRKLRYFVGLVDAGGFRRAADALGIAQPALTRQIRSLEVELEVQLVTRSKAGVTLLPAGQTLLDEAREILARVDRIPDLMAARHKSEAAGEVLVGLPSALADMYLGPLVEMVKAAYPEIKIVCREGMPDAATQVEQSLLDLAVISSPVEDRRYDCNAEILLREQDYMVAKDAERFGTQVSLLDLFAMPLVLTPLPNARRQHLQVLAAQHGAKLSVVAEAATAMAQFDLVARGLGVAVLPMSAARMVKREGLLMKPVENLWSYRVLLTTRIPRRPLATNAVAQVLRALFLSAGPQPS